MEETKDNSFWEEDRLYDETIDDYDDMMDRHFDDEIDSSDEEEDFLEEEEELEDNINPYTSEDEEQRDYDEIEE